MDKDEFLRNLGAQIRKVREQKGYSQDRLELEAGIPRGNISRIESGLVDAQSWTIWRMAETIGVPVKKFFDF